MSELDFTIPPEVVNDELSETLERLAARGDVRNILEIGSSSGEGSTKALYQGMKERWRVSSFFCMEVSKPRYKQLLTNYRGYSDPRLVFVNVSSVFLDEFPNEKLVSDFYYNIRSPLDKYPLDTVLGWLRQDKAYIEENNILCDGIYKIKRIYKVDNFDLVFIDGSEFTGMCECQKVFGSKIIVLDDICSFKNYYSYLFLANHKEYKLIQENKKLRHGYAVFEKI
jgi:hypothetical protein